ncbi:hypothetical protein TNCV_903971 [Trichonephila clavipes]|nr:hypothetical protein TNCV_903971 [Trichonephila clavipes]
MATLFQPNPRSEVGKKDANYEPFKYQKLEKSGKKMLSLQETLDLLQNLPEIRDVLTDDFSKEEVPINNLLEFSLDF